jgi:hypothetical protein
MQPVKEEETKTPVAKQEDKPSTEEKITPAFFAPVVPLPESLSTRSGLHCVSAYSAPGTYAQDKMGPIRSLVAHRDSMLNQIDGLSFKDLAERRSGSTQSYSDAVHTKLLEGFSFQTPNVGTASPLMPRAWCVTATTRPTAPAASAFAALADNAQRLPRRAMAQSSSVVANPVVDALSKRAPLAQTSLTTPQPSSTFRLSALRSSRVN